MCSVSVDVRLSRCERDLAGKNRDDAEIDQRQVAEHLSCDEPQAEPLLADPVQQKRRQPQSNQDDGGLVDVADGRTAENAPRAAHE